MAIDHHPLHRIDPADLPDESVIFGSTLAMREVRSRVANVLSSDFPVLIQGESGTGKEVVARFLHLRSNRKDFPFVKLNCAAIPAALLESELFGFEKGAFTGAARERVGLVEIAEGGTLFLDEIGDLHFDLQGKLLSLLEDGSYCRIGGSSERRANVRVICATGVDLKNAVDEGLFRDDLYYRIDVVSVRLSPLRTRKEDIPQLCAYFIKKLATQFNRPEPRLSSTTMQLFQEWNWPGNMRELENWIARAIILGDDASLCAELKSQVAMKSAIAARENRSGSLKEVSRRAATAVSSALILRVLEANRWNRRKTADELNMSYRSLLYKLREAKVPQRRRSHRGFPPAH